MMAKSTGDDRQSGLYDSSRIERETVRRRYPLPLESVASLKQDFDEAVFRAQSSRTHEQRSLGEHYDVLEREEGPSWLARAFDQLRLYAYPNDYADWDALERARDHREGMPSGRDPIFAASTLGFLSEWQFIGPRRFDVGGGHWVSGRVNTVAIDPKNNSTMYAGAAGGGVWKTMDRGVTWK